MTQNEPKPEHETDHKKSRLGLKKLGMIAGVVVVFAVAFYLVQTYLSIDYLAEQEARLIAFYEAQPVLVYVIAFLIYAIVAGLSIPGGAVFLTLFYAWFFGFTRAFILVSFASTLGATLAFWTSRYILRDWIESRFNKQMKTFHETFEREGLFYLFMMRLIPAFPFYIVNLLMGLTRIRTWTYWWVSQIGMLAGTATFVYAGSQIPDLATLKEHGVNAVFSPKQLFQFTIAFALIGLVPIVIKKLVALYQNRTQSSPQ